MQKSEVNLSHTHVFVLKIWLEESQEKTGKSLWRGHITHVQSGERQYFQSLDQICIYLIPYLEAMDVKTGWYWKIRQTWQQFTGRKHGKRG